MVIGLFTSVDALRVAIRTCQFGANTIPKTMKQVGIIGAGAAGLTALQQSLKIPDWNVVAWEQNSIVGGTWVLNDSIGIDNHGYPIHSSMYRSLRTNLPKEIMGFLDEPFPDEEESFIHHTSVLNYLESYAKHNSLFDHIKMEHHVENVTRVLENSEPCKWKVTVKSLETNSVQDVICDFLFICNGHYSCASIPHIEGMENFEGNTLHSHDYRSPDLYRKCKVALLGAGPSGVDIALEVSSVAEKVYLCHDLPQSTSCILPGNMIERAGIKSAKANGFLLKDGSCIEVDHFICCTGYKFSFPFLDTTCGVEVIDNNVRPLYKQVLHSTYPTMGFIGLPVTAVPFPLFHVQAQFLVSVFSGKLKLPSREARAAETELERQSLSERGVATRHLHKLGALQWKYVEDLSEQASGDLYPAFIQKIYDTVGEERRKNVTTFKKNKFVLNNSNDFELKTNEP